MRLLRLLLGFMISESMSWRLFMAFVWLLKGERTNKPLELVRSARRASLMGPAGSELEA
jgi:hypothetical protein